MYSNNSASYPSFLFHKFKFLISDIRILSAIGRCANLMSAFCGHCPRLKTFRPIFVNLILALTVCYVFVGSCEAKRRFKIQISVIAPSSPSEDEEILDEIVPSVKLAIEAVTNPIHGILASHDIELLYRDTNCSATFGPLAAIDLHNASGKE